MSGAIEARPMRPRGGLGFAIVLIGVGLAALLANLGFLNVSWGAVLALWPLLLVIAGVDLLLARRAPLAALAVDVAVVAVGFALILARPFGAAFPSVFPFVNVVDCPGGTAQASVAVPKSSTTSYTLRLTGGAGTFTVTGGASDLVNATSDANDLYLRTSGSDVRLTQCTSANVAGPRNVRVQIADDVPVSLNVEGGAGTFTLDLRSAQLRELRVTNGAATTEIDLPKPSGNVPIRLTGGASTITIDLGGADASVEVTGGLTTLNAPDGAGGGTLAGRQVWSSRGYTSARDRYTIEVTGGASTVTVR